MKFISGIKNFIKLIFKNFFDLIYRRKCLNCHCSINEGFLCKTCLKTVEKLPFFAQGIINGYKVYSCFYYEGAVKRIIQALKFKHNKDIAPYAAYFLKEYIDKIKEYEKENLNFKNACIVPVVTHKNNHKSRGYDNVYEMALELSKITGFKLKNILVKTKYTKHQYKITSKQRRLNIWGSFELKSADIKPSELVILLDDIITTGSTLEYITSLFKEKGVNNLICLTLSKTRKN